MSDFSIGVDLGGTNLRIAAVSAEGQLLDKVTLDTKVALGPRQVIDRMCAAIQRLSESYKRTGKPLGAGIGVPGLVDVQTGVMRKAANLPGFENYPAGAEIQRRLGTRVVVENDAKVAALGEQWLGAARGVPNVAIVTLGTGIGGGIILEGKIWQGMNGMAGEFGHVTLEPQGFPCGCGNHGCSERYASASAIARMVREEIATGKAPSLAQAASSDAEFGAKSIYNLAIQGDEPARRIFCTFGRYLGILLANLINTLNLEMYVLGGGVASAWDAYAPAMFEELRTRSLVYSSTAPVDPLANVWGRTPSPVQPEPTSAAAGRSTNPSPQTEIRKTIITLAVLGSDAGLYGAARAAVLAG
ncbi:MAG: ROK family protein [Candidatus Sulfotelmatobacter sp.]